MSRTGAGAGSPVFQLLVFLAVACPYFINLGTPTLWDANEAFYAETPREMLESGDYLAPRFNYQPRSKKPPLTYWAVLLSYRLFGVNEAAVRVPGALAAAGVLLFTFLLGRMLFNSNAALLAVVMMGTTGRFFAIARKLPIDILLLFFLTGAAWFLVRAVSNGKTRDWLLAYLFAALGFLTKGPVAVVIPAAALLAWALWSRRLRPAQCRPLWGALVLIAVVAPWYIFTYRHYGWTYISEFFLRDNLARFASEPFGPARGPLFYFPAYFADFFPWSLLSIAAVYHLWTERGSLRSDNALAFGFPLIWCGVVLLLFSLSKNKQDYYIAPLYPPAAVLLGGILERTLLSKQAPVGRLRGLMVWLTFLTALALLAAAVFLLFVMRPFIPEAPVVLHYAPTVVLLLASIALACSMARGNRSSGFFILGFPIWLLFLMAPVFYLPAIAPLQPVAELCRTVGGAIRPDDEAGYYRATVPSMVFYLHRPIFEEFDAETMVKRFEGPRRVFCIMTEEDYNYFVGERDLILHVLDRGPRLITRLSVLLDEDAWAGQELVLASNQPAAALPEGRKAP